MDRGGQTSQSAGFFGFFCQSMLSFEGEREEGEMFLVAVESGFVRQMACGGNDISGRIDGVMISGLIFFDFFDHF